MLIVEHQSNGKRIVKLHKDWHPSMVGKGYMPRQKNYVDSRAMERVQQALLRKDPR